MDINNYMSPTEAAYRWNLPVKTVREKLNADRRPIALEQEIKDGLIKGFTLPEGKSTTWIISVRAMEKWYGPEPKK